MVGASNPNLERHEIEKQLLRHHQGEGDDQRGMNSKGISKFIKLVSVSVMTMSRSVARRAVG